MAVVDLGPIHDGTRERLLRLLGDNGFAPVVGDGVELALAGERVSRDGVALTTALSNAQAAFGRLDCPATQAAAKVAIGLGAQRQAAGFPAGELKKALILMLLCSDRTGDVDQAATFAQHLRVLGGTADVPENVWAKYPEIDTLGENLRVPLEISADVPGAAIWIDFMHAGTSPVTVWLGPGEHVIAAATGTRRGWAAGTAVASQTRLTIPTATEENVWAEVTQAITAWNHEVPPSTALGEVMNLVDARVVLVRRGDRVVAFGRAGRGESPHQLGGPTAVATVAETPRLLSLIRDRVAGWHARSPDPDRPLLVESDADPRSRSRERPTKWWIYASVIGAVAVGAVVWLGTEQGTDRQRVELHLP